MYCPFLGGKPPYKLLQSILIIFKIFNAIDMPLNEFDINVANGIVSAPAL